ncbi:hypothetical protein BVX93_00740, partial [bacterium B13(2017)]
MIKTPQKYLILIILFFFKQNIFYSYDLDEYIVYGTFQKLVSNLTSSVNVIDKTEINNSTVKYVMDIISSFPGIYVRSDGILGRQKVEIRGLGSNCRRILTLIDGRPEKMSLFGCTVTQSLPLSNIERIEIIRGPESVLFGSDALGGVINIITNRIKEEGFETEFLLSYGKHETSHSLLKNGGKIKKFDYYCTIDYKNSNGHRVQSEYKSYDSSLSLGYQILDNYRIEFTAKYFEDDG